MELPAPDAREQLVHRYAHIREIFGSELGERPLVRQTAEFFPDAFEQDQASVQRLIQRIATHAGLQDIPIEVSLAGAGAPAAGGSCGTGGCSTPKPAAQEMGARLEETSEGWRVNIETGELGHPGALACILATSLGRIFLEETSSPDCQPQAPIEVSTELVCVNLGLGLLLLEGSYIYSKSCGGPSVAQLTKLSVGQLAIACALFVQVGEHSARQARSSLSTTQRAVMAEALSWTASNANKLKALRNSPAVLTTGALNLKDARPWLVRLLDRPKQLSSEERFEQALNSQFDPLLRATTDTPRAPKKPNPERDELSAMVEEALRSS